MHVNPYRCLLLLIVCSACWSVPSQHVCAQSATSAVKMARLKYSGGGDWYNDPSCEVNLMNFVRQNTNIQAAPVYEYVDVATDNIFLYPMLFLTGHGTVSFSDADVRRLRSYLENGGFLYVDDDYGLDASIRRELKKIFPQQELRELPFSHPLFHAHFDFPNGVPKTHEHDAKTPQTFAMFDGDRVCVLYTYESNPSDGWADPEVHGDPQNKRIESLQFGTNIVVYALGQRSNPLIK